MPSLHRCSVLSAQSHILALIGLVRVSNGASRPKDSLRLDVVAVAARLAAQIQRSTTAPYQRARFLRLVRLFLLPRGTVEGFRVRQRASFFGLLCLLEISTDGRQLFLGVAAARVLTHLAAVRR